MHHLGAWPSQLTRGLTGFDQGGGRQSLAPFQQLGVLMVSHRKLHNNRLRVATPSSKLQQTRRCTRRRLVIVTSVVRLV